MCIFANRKKKQINQLKMKNLILFLFFALIGIQPLNAQEAYVVLTEADSTLTFYYDDNKSSYTEKTFTLNSGWEWPQWTNDSTKIKSVVFDESFADARPNTTYYWFFKMRNLTSITGIQYLNTDEVTTMYCMFDGCRGLTSLDLSNFNTEKVKYIGYMFHFCTNMTNLNLSHFDMSGEPWKQGMCLGLSTESRACTITCPTAVRTALAHGTDLPTSGVVFTWVTP